jgi:hypothetical protein
MNSDALADGSPNGADLAAFPAAAKLVERVGEFIQEVQNLYVCSFECTHTMYHKLTNKQDSGQRSRTPLEPRLRAWKPILRRPLLAGENRDRRGLGGFRRAGWAKVSTWQSTYIHEALSLPPKTRLPRESQQSLIRRIHRYLLPPRPHSTCPSRPSSSTRKKSTQVNTTSTRTARSTASFRSMTPSS